MSTISQDIGKVRSNYIAKYRTLPECIEIKKSALVKLYPEPIEPQVLFPKWKSVAKMQTDFYLEEVKRRNEWLADPKYYKGMRVVVLPEDAKTDWRFPPPEEIPEENQIIQRALSALPIPDRTTSQFIKIAVTPPTVPIVKNRDTMPEEAEIMVYEVMFEKLEPRPNFYKWQFMRIVHKGK